MAEIDSNFPLNRFGLPDLQLRGDEEREGALSRLQRAREEREEAEEDIQTRARTDRVNVIPEGQQRNDIRLAEDVVRREAEAAAAPFLNLDAAQPAIEPEQQADVIAGNLANQNEVGLNQFSGNLRNIRDAGDDLQIQNLNQANAAPRGPVGDIQQTFRPEFGIDALDDVQVGQPNLIQPGEVGFIARVQQAAVGEETGPQQILEAETEQGVIGAIQATFRPEFGLETLDDDQEGEEGFIARVQQAATDQETGPQEILEAEAEQGVIGVIQATFLPEFGLETLDDDQEGEEGFIARVQQAATDQDIEQQEILESDVEGTGLAEQAGPGVIGAIQATFRPGFGLETLDDDQEGEEGFIARIQQAATDQETGAQPILEAEVENPNLVNQAGQGVVGNIQATFRPEFGVETLDDQQVLQPNLIEPGEEGFIGRIQQTAAGQETGPQPVLEQPTGGPNLLNPIGQGPVGDIQQRAEQPEAEFGEALANAPTNLLDPGTAGPVGRIRETATEEPTGPQQILELGGEDVNLADPAERGPIGNIQQAFAQQESPAEPAVNLQQPNLAEPGALGPIERIQQEGDPEQQEDNPAQRQPESNLIDDTEQGPIEEVQQNLAPPPGLEQEPPQEDADTLEPDDLGPVGNIQQTAVEEPPEPNIERLNENSAALRRDFLRTDRPLRENRELRNLLENQPEPEPEPRRVELEPAPTRAPAPEPGPAPEAPIPIQERVATTPGPTPPVLIEDVTPVPPEPVNEPVEVEVEAEEELTIEQQLALAIEDAEEVPPPPPPDPEAIVTERGLNLNQII